ncbi:MAG: tetratricopeptide repeat protein [Prolixibacteraceae bacterium]
MKNYFLLLILFLLPIIHLGNTSVQDSLLRILPELEDSIQIQIYEELSILPDIPKDQQINYLNQALLIAKKTDNPVTKANILLLLGRAYESIGNFDLALVACQEALTLLNENHKAYESTKVLSLIGEVYVYLENFDMAINHFKKVLDISLQLGNESHTSKALINVGNVLGIQGHLDEAMGYYQKALSIKEKLGDPNGLSQLYNNIANIHFAKGELNKVLPYRIKALEMDRESGDEWQIALKTYNLAEYYLAVNDPGKAYTYIIESKTLAEKLENYGLINDNIQFLSLYYELIKDFPKALEYQKLYAKTIKETFSKELSERVGEMEVKYETEKQDKETQSIKLQLEKSSNQKLILALLVIIGFLISSFIAFLYFKKKKNNQFLEKEVLRRTNELIHKNIELENNSIELIKSKEKAEESDRLKTAFLSNVSHEIRTPLNGILGFSSLLINPNLTNSDKEKYGGIIKKGSDRLLATIDNIVEASRIQTKQAKTSKSKLIVNKLIEDIYIKFNSLNKNEKIKFSFTIELQNDESTIYSDESKIEAILSHLLNNAFKFTQEGCIDFGYYQENNFLNFYVKDTGIGVPMERQAAIFNFFVQSDIEDHHAYQGSGLGLFLAKSYVDLLGGKIWMNSVDGTGSSFNFSIPYS